MKFNKELLNIIVCPLSKEKLIYDENNNCLVAKTSKLSYPIKDGIPITRNMHRSLPGLTLSDFLIFNKWLNFKKTN